MLGLKRGSGGVYTGELAAKWHSTELSDWQAWVALVVGHRASA
jgi:hypothetical protein